MRALKRNKKNVVLLTITFAFALFGLNRTIIPTTSLISNDEIIEVYSQSRENNINQQISIDQFIESVYDGNGAVIRGVFQQGNMALAVIQQPSNNAAFVSAEDGVATQFSMAKNYGTIGLLAHNYAAGRHFFSVSFGDILHVVYGDGTVSNYLVTEILSYQALSPNSPYSQFKNLYTGEIISATQMFKRVYTGAHHLTLQTCIEQESIDSWGRLFIIAEPLN